METAKNAANFVSDKISSATNAASKEANKNVAKDSDVSLTSRVSAAGDAIQDKMHEKKDDASAEANKQKASH